MTDIIQNTVNHVYNDHTYKYPGNKLNVTNSHIKQSHLEAPIYQEELWFLHVHSEICT